MLRVRKDGNPLGWLALERGARGRGFGRSSEVHFGWKKSVCFFVLCNRHWFNRVPGPNRDGGYLYTLRFCSDASYADLPLPLLGAPVSIEALVKLGSRSLAKQDRD